MARRVNIMMDEDSWQVLQRLPRGSRSRAVNARSGSGRAPPAGGMPRRAWMRFGNGCPQSGPTGSSGG